MKRLKYLLVLLALLVGGMVAAQSQTNITLDTSGMFSPAQIAAGASGNMVEFGQTVLAMDGTDTVRGFFLDFTNADHTGATNFLYGLDIDTITGDADAAEAAIHVGHGWDTTIWTTQALSFQSGWDQFNFQDDAVPVIYIGVHPYAGASFTWIELRDVLAALDGADDYVRGIWINLANANHSNGNVYGIDLDLDAEDAQANEIAIHLTGGWDWDFQSVGTAFASLGAPANGTFVYCTDCDQTSSPCASTPGPGTFAFRVNGAWECPF